MNSGRGLADARRSDGEGEIEGEEQVDRDDDREGVRVWDRAERNEGEEDVVDSIMFVVVG